MALFLALALLFLTYTAVFAQTHQDGASSTLYLADTDTQFSLSIADASSDVHIYISTPANSWFGIGFGADMRDSLMLVVYPDQHGNITLSPRLSHNAAEPAFASSVAIDILPDSHLTPTKLTLHARCTSCRVWPSGYLDTATTAYPMSYAFGPARGVLGGGPDAGLRRHDRFGRFTMDLRAATGMLGTLGPSEARGTEILGGAVKDGNRAGVAHAVVGCVGVLGVWPLNVVVRGFVGRTWAGGAVAGVLGASLGVAYALGIKISGSYVRSSSFTSPHQVLALVTILPLLLLPVLSLPRLATKHPFIPRLHGPLSSITLALLLTTGGLGLRLSHAPHSLVITYSVLSLLAILVCAAAQFLIHRRLGREIRGVCIHDSGTDTELILRSRPSLWSLGTQDRARKDSVASCGDASGQARLQGKMGGAMPGPQYLLNMHPGVPVHRW